MATTGLGVRRIWICRSSTLSRPIPLLGHLVVADVAVVAPDALVAAGAEGLGALPGEDDHADVVVVAGPVEGVGQLEEGLGPEGVAHLRPADRDLGDPLRRGLVADVAVGVVGRTLPGRLGRTRRRRSRASWPGQHRTWIPCAAMPDLVAAGPAGRARLRRRRSSGSGTRRRRASRSTSACPPPARRRCSTAMAPASLVDADGEHAPGRRPRRSRPATRWSWPPAARPASPRASCSPTTPWSASAAATSTPARRRPDGDHWLACLPLAHVGGLSVVTRALVTGTPLTVLPGLRRRRGRGRRRGRRHPRLARGDRPGPHRPGAVPGDRARRRPAARRARRPTSSRPTA